MKNLKVILIILTIILVVLTILEIRNIGVLSQWEKSSSKDTLYYQKKVTYAQNILSDNNILNAVQTSVETESFTSKTSETNINSNNMDKIENIINNNKDNTNESDNSSNNKNVKNKELNKDIKFDETVAFIGDSRTQGFIMYNGLSKVQNYSYVGLMVDTAKTKEFVKTSDGKKITLLQDMKDKNIRSIYIMLGINELGWSYPSVFKLKYKELIEEIKRIKPNSNIYIQSIIPVTRNKDQSDKIYNNSRVKEFNKLIKEVAYEMNIKYIDVASALIDKQGYLPDAASTDGIHIGIEYCHKWLDYLKNNS